MKCSTKYSFSIITFPYFYCNGPMQQLMISQEAGLECVGVEGMIVCVWLHALGVILMYLGICGCFVVHHMSLLIYSPSLLPGPHMIPATPVLIFLYVVYSWSTGVVRKMPWIWRSSCKTPSVKASPHVKLTPWCCSCIVMVLTWDTNFM